MADPVPPAGIAPRQAVLTCCQPWSAPKGPGAANRGLPHQSYMTTC